MVELQTAAVAVIDALGFKGIWKREGVSIPKLADALTEQRLRGEMGGYLEQAVGFPGFHYAGFSDTVVMCAFAGSERRWNMEPAHAALEVVASRVVSLITAMSQAVPGGLAYRGCISVGPTVIVRDDLFLGPGIDEASEWHEKAKAAAVWLMPSACSVLPSDGRTLPSFFTWRVPLGEAGTLRTKVLNPFTATIDHESTDRADWPALSAKVDAQLGCFLSPFDVGLGAGRIDVAVKKENTADLLAAAKRHSWKCLESASLAAESKLGRSGG